MSQKLRSAAGAISAGRIYSLEKAVAFLNVDADIVLEHAVQGTISLFTDIPDDVVIYGTSMDLIEYHDPSLDPYKKIMLRSQVSGKTPIALAGVRYVRLSTSDCSVIQKCGECSQAVYSGALYTDAAQELAEMPLPSVTSSIFGGDADFPFARRVACYAAGADATQRPGALKKIRIIESSLRILGKDIDVLQAIIGTQSDLSSTAPFEDGFVEQAYMSKRLIVLHRAAVAFWNPNQEPPAKPINGNIADWILQEYLTETGAEFGKVLAMNMVKLIRRSYENWDQVRFNGLAAKGDLTWFQAVVEVGEAWSTVDVTQRDNISKKIKEELINSFRLPQQLAECAVTILRPEGVVAAGRPKQKIN